MLKRVYVLGILAMLALAPAIQAGPIRLSDVSSQATWLAHINVDGMRTSPVAESFINACFAQGEMAQSVKEMAANFGIEIGKGLHGVTAYGTKFGTGHGVLIVRAEIDKERLTKMAEEAPDHQTLQIGDHTVHTWTYKHDGGIGTAAGTCVGPDVLVMAGSVETLKSAIGVLGGQAANLEGAKTPLATAAPEGALVVFRATGINDSPVAEKIPFLAQLTQIDYCEGPQGDQYTGRIIAVTDSPQVAEHLKEAANGLTSLLWLHFKSGPAIREILDDMKVSCDGNTVHVQFQAAAETVIQAMPEMCTHIQEAHD